MENEMRKWIDLFKNKNIIKENKDTSHWYDLKDLKDQQKVFSSDVTEYLTGHFGTVGTENYKKIYNIIGKIFKQTISRTYEHGISATSDQIEQICKLLKLKKDEYSEYSDEDVSMVIYIIDIIFNGDDE